jgi:hypothetical protein
MAYTKTLAGTDEIKTRALKLPAPLRNLLLMVDGLKTATELEAIAQSLGAPAGSVAELVQRGLITDEAITASKAALSGADITLVQNPLRAAERNAESYTRLQQTMNDMARNMLGLRSVFMIMKIEKCMSLADLKKLYPDFETAIVKAGGKQVGETLCMSIRKELLE